MNSKDTPDLGDCGGDALELCGPNANCFSKYQGKAYACVCKYGGVHPSCPDEPYDNQSSQKFLISTKNKTFLINVNDENEVENTSIKKEKLDKSGSLTSRNFPSNYPNNLDTEEDISVAAGERIKLQFIDFKIEDHSSCAYDYLMVEDADGTVLLDKTCGSTLPKDVTSRTNTVIVIFHSDGSVSDSGWRIDWQKLTNSGIRCDTAAECPEYRPFCFGGTCSECMEDEDCPPYSNTTGGICVFFDHCCLPGYC